MFYIILYYILGGTTPCVKTAVDHWILFAIEKLADTSNIKDELYHIDAINRALFDCTFLVNKRLTLADVYIFSALLNKQFIKHHVKRNYVNLTRWYKHMESLHFVKNALSIMSENSKTNFQTKDVTPEKEKHVDAKSVEAKSETKQAKTRKQEGKFVDLPGAEMGKVKSHNTIM